MDSDGDAGRSAVTVPVPKEVSRCPGGRGCPQQFFAGSRPDDSQEPAGAGSTRSLHLLPWRIRHFSRNWLRRKGAPPPLSDHDDFRARAPTPKSAAGQQISIPTDQDRAAGLRPETRGRSDRFRRLRRGWPFPSRVLCWHRRGVRPFDDASSADARRSAALSRRRLPLRRGRARR
jgi:hypothetical protein